MVKKKKKSLQYKKGKSFHNARKSLHFDEKDTCMKKQSGLFDVTMRAWYNAEVCELVDTYMLLFISENYNKKDFRLYHDDGLGVVKIKEMKKNEKKYIYIKEIKSWNTETIINLRLKRLKSHNVIKDTITVT